jgi:hypothetical protein
MQNIIDKKINKLDNTFGIHYRATDHTDKKNFEEYKPFIEKLDVADWGQCEDEQKKEFISVFDKFANELREALKSLQSNITLDQYDRKWDNEIKN